MSPLGPEAKPSITFSVVIPVYNGESSITAAVESVRAQSHPGEIIVVDDGSDDGTPAVLSKLAESSVATIRVPNAGPAAARNAGARLATGEYLVFLDADDELLTGALSAFATQHHRQHRLVRSGALIDRGTQGTHTWFAEPSRHPYPRGAPLAGTFSIERALFHKVGGYDPKFRFGENSEMLLRAQMALQEVPNGPVFTQRPTVRRIVQVDRSKAHYHDHTLQAALRMLQMHSDVLKLDLTTLSNHHAIAANLLSNSGEQRRALQHAVAAARSKPNSWRAWARLIRTLLPQSLLRQPTSRGTRARRITLKSRQEG